MNEILLKMKQNAGLLRLAELIKLINIPNKQIKFKLLLDKVNLRLGSN